jgi:hypothetical protein
MAHNIAVSTTALSVHLSLRTAAITQHILNHTQPISHRTAGITHGITQIAAPVPALALIATKAVPEPVAAMVELPIVADTILAVAASGTNDRSDYGTLPAAGDVASASVRYATYDDATDALSSARIHRIERVVLKVRA